jgi:hypothetical protein
MPCPPVTSGYHSHQPHLTPAAPARRGPVTALARHCPPVRAATGHQAKSNGTGRFHPGLNTNKSVQGALARCPVQVGLPRCGRYQPGHRGHGRLPPGRERDSAVSPAPRARTPPGPFAGFPQLGAEAIYLIAGHPRRTEPVVPHGVKGSGPPCPVPLPGRRCARVAAAMALCVTLEQRSSPAEIRAYEDDGGTGPVSQAG